MKRASVLILLSFLLIGCDFKLIKDEGKVLSDDMMLIEQQDSLAFELCEIYGLDQGIRQRGILEHIINTDAGKAIEQYNFEKIIDFIVKYGYPTERIVGKRNYEMECVNSAAWAVLLHNPKKVRENHLDLLLDEVNKGNMTYENIANILDKEIWANSRGEDVLYGSDFGMPCSFQKEETQAARKKAGLPPLDEALFENCD